MGIKTAKFLIGVLLVPVCIGVTLVAIRLVGIWLRELEKLIPLLVGAIAWLVGYRFLNGWERAYVLAHELTHWLAAFLFGYRLRRIHVGQKSGFVELEKTNFVVDLAPYLFPFYTAVIVAVGAITGLIIRKWWYPPTFHFLLGFSLAFHFKATMAALATKQSDITRHGCLFSLTVIYLATAMWFIAALAIIAGKPSLLTIGCWTVEEVMMVLRKLFLLLAGLVSQGWSSAQGLA